MRFLKALVAMVFLLSIPQLWAQTTKEVEELRSVMEADRLDIVSKNLELTAEEEERFWGLYRTYRRDMSKLGDRAADLIGQYARNWGDVSEELAEKLVRDYLQVQVEQHQMKMAYIDRFKEVLPNKKIFRLYQIENKLDALVRFELADSIPLIE
ncbi:MAG: hypothetical protein JSU96_14425 [Acidobacteriota bacterium]|nr:MAG: hypothetical protein JSU96_14425 [Acidobacteriota bacterium]